MKRHLSTPDGPFKRRPRQNPVSCESCRKKKLKCDRVLPCSSCSARDIQCSYGDYGPVSERGSAHRGTTPNTRAESIAAPPEIPESPSRRQGVTQQIQEIRNENLGRDDPLLTANRLETIVMGHRVPSGFPATMRQQLARSRVESPRSSLGSTPGIHPDQPPSHHNPATVPLIAYLPTEGEMVDLFDYYCYHLDYQYHLIMIHRTRQDMHALYEAIALNQPVDLGTIALLFSIASSALFFKLLATQSADYAEATSRETAFLAGAALIQGNYMTCPSLAGLQATMIVGHHINGLAMDPAVSAFFVPGAMIAQAKSLGLHVIDCPASREEREANGYDKTEVELKRRIWWDLATYDWLLGFLSGPQEFTYSVNPQHMNVRIPLNIEDEDVETGIECPESTPTCMSYTVIRLRLAEICREIVDKTAPMNLRGEDVPYEQILELDKKLNEGYAALPDFFRFDTSSRRKYASLYRERPVLAWQRAFAQQGYQARICRLHRNYFVRGAKDPRYSYSHMVSLQSARKVIELKRIMDEDDPPMVSNGSFFWAVMHHVFMAAVTLLINVCFNWDDILAEKQKEEVLEACRMLSQAQQVSSVAREGINAMMGTLRKHWKHQKRPSSGGSQPEPEFRVEAQQPTPSSFDMSSNEVGQISSATAFQPSQNSLDAPNILSSPADLEDLWTEMLDDSTNIGLDTPGWMDLLTDLAHTNVPY